MNRMAGIGRARLDHLGRLKAPLLLMIGKHFLFVRTGMGAPQIDAGDFNRARPILALVDGFLHWPAMQNCNKKKLLNKRRNGQEDRGQSRQDDEWTVGQSKQP